MKFNKKIGIIGGMGAAASARFYNILVSECQTMGSVKDSDFPEMIIHNLPTKGISEYGIADADTLKYDLEYSVKMMAREYVDLVLIACNTAYYFIDYLRSITSMNIMDMVNLTVLKCLKKEKVGLLSTRSTRDLGIYTKAFKRTDVELLVTNEAQQKKIDKLIADITLGEINGGNILREVMDEMFDYGTERIILGCTELPLCYTGKSKKIIDAGENAIKEALKLCCHS